MIILRLSPYPDEKLVSDMKLATKRSTVVNVSPNLSHLLRSPLFATLNIGTDTFLREVFSPPSERKLGVKNPNADTAQKLKTPILRNSDVVINPLPG